MHLDGIRRGGKRALASALTRIEAAQGEAGLAALLDAAFGSPAGFSLGLTGPPGVGKSTLIDALLRAWRRRGKTAAVIAVDPSSATTGGALLGDRTRMTTDPADRGIFVRSMAARDRLGGLAAPTFPSMVLMRALYDLVIVETVGVGQSETEIAGTVDLVAYLAQPGSGDSLQFMKAGIMEVPDLIAVTKTDLGVLARRTISDLKGALSLGAGAKMPVVTGVSAANGDGIIEFLQEICTILQTRSPDLPTTRKRQLAAWAERQISQKYGSEGLKCALGDMSHGESLDTFFAIEAIDRRLAVALTAAFE